MNSFENPERERKPTVRDKCCATRWLAACRAFGKPRPIREGIYGSWAVECSHAFDSVDCRSGSKGRVLPRAHWILSVFYVYVAQSRNMTSLCVLEKYKYVKLGVWKATCIRRLPSAETMRIVVITFRLHITSSIHCKDGFVLRHN